LPPFDLESLELESWKLRDIPSVNVDRQPRLWVLSLVRKPPWSY